ncbi:MAG: glycosyltransferase [Bacilli bacterium]|nr:glycosyltransferase [Bacilli bacterium]
MRIGLFSDSYPPFINGVSTSILMLKTALEKKGHTVFVITINNENLNYKCEENNRVIRIPGLPIGIYDFRLSGLYPLKAANMIRKMKLDIIHCHTEFSIGIFSRIIAKQLNIPLVHTYHTMYEDYIYYITKGYFNGISKKVVEYLTVFYCDKTISELVVPTKKAYDLFKEKYNVARNIYIVPTGIDVERFYQEKYPKKKISELKEKIGIGKDDFVILTVGRIASEKNIKLLLECQKSLIKSHDHIKLVIVGDGPDMEAYKKQVTKEEFKNSVIFTGKVPLADIPLYYQLGNVFVTASKTETQGLTVIEAMAASVPVVCIKDESFMNTVVDDLNGYMFRTKKEYRNHIINLYNSPDKLERLSKNARTSASQHSSKYYAEQILDVYKIAIENYKVKQGEGIKGKIKTVMGLNK